MIDAPTVPEGLAAMAAGGTERRSLTLLQRQPPIIWANVIDAMMEAGFSLRQIGSALAVPHSTVQTWRGRGSCPNYEDGRALLQLFEMVQKLGVLPPVRIS